MRNNKRDNIVLSHLTCKRVNYLNFWFSTKGSCPKSLRAVQMNCLVFAKEISTTHSSTLGTHPQMETCICLRIYVAFQKLWGTVWDMFTATILNFISTLAIFAVISHFHLWDTSWNLFEIIQTFLSPDAMQFHMSQI